MFNCSFLSSRGRLLQWKIEKFVSHKTPQIWTQFLSTALKTKSWAERSKQPSILPLFQKKLNGNTVFKDPFWVFLRLFWLPSQSDNPGDTYLFLSYTECTAAMGEQALAVQLKPTVALCSPSCRPQDVVLGYKALLSHSPPWQGDYREGEGERSKSSEGSEAAEPREKARGQDGGGGARWGREPPMGQFYWCIYSSWEDFNGFIWEGLYAAFLFVPSLVNGEEAWQCRQSGGTQSLSLQST